MENVTTRGVRKLRNTDLASINYKADIRGQTVHDVGGRYVGQVDALFIDDEERRVRFFRASPGWSNETGGNGHADRFLIPVDVVTRVTASSVQLDLAREELAVADMDESRLGDATVLEALYSYYGRKPFWSPGYSYPPYPFFV